ncbi:uncharacterized protein LOC142571232 [Dermacentor variabilis]|uniref:uncharacterized protein LOC142571232 n=1 Tax=Dermacentor variabilis TaxID=34621 RepID=UPI003F5B9AC5
MALCSASEPMQAITFDDRRQSGMDMTTEAHSPLIEVGANQEAHIAEQTVHDEESGTRGHRSKHRRHSSSGLTVITEAPPHLLTCMRRRPPLSATLLLLSLAHEVACHSAGAPASSCKEMEPRHNFKPQNQHHNYQGDDSANIRHLLAKRRLQPHTHQLVPKHPRCTVSAASAGGGIPAGLP